eukprot:9298977-Pyramimonas_sp.AAC.1
MAKLACGSCTQCSVWCLHRKLHEWPQWQNSHAVPSPGTALRGPIGNSTERPTGGTRTRFMRPV